MGVNMAINLLRTLSLLTLVLEPACTNNSSTAVVSSTQTTSVDKDTNRRRPDDDIAATDGSVDNSQLQWIALCGVLAILLLVLALALFLKKNKKAKSASSAPPRAQQTPTNRRPGLRRAHSVAGNIMPWPKPPQVHKAPPQVTKAQPTSITASVHPPTPQLHQDDTAFEAPWMPIISHVDHPSDDTSGSSDTKSSSTGYDVPSEMPNLGPVQMPKTASTLPPKRTHPFKKPLSSKTTVPSKTPPPKKTPPSKTPPPNTTPPPKTTPPSKTPPPKTTPPSKTPPPKTTPPSKTPPPKTTTPSKTPPPKTTPPSNIKKKEITTTKPDTKDNQKKNKDKS